MNMIYENTDMEKKLARRIFLENLKECEIFPKYIMIEPIDVCNARCVMCKIGNQEKGVCVGGGCQRTILGVFYSVGSWSLDFAAASSFTY